jgi:glycosyltransferase involved in cell wall biosynthesis
MMAEDFRGNSVNSSTITKNILLNFRAAIIDVGLETVSKVSADNSFNAVEVGSMFRANEGLSTYLIAHFIQQCRGQKRFISIDCDSEHIDACKQMLEDSDPTLLSEIKFLYGDSLEMLPVAFNEMQSVDLVLLDGGAGPECCLREFELAIQSLSENGLVVIDDLQDMAPTEAYPFPRLFGKGTLILPYMVIAEYMKVRDISCSKKDNITTDPKNASKSGLIAQTPSSELMRLLGNLGYLVISKGSHKMMVVGKTSILESFRCHLATKRISSVEIVPTGMFRDAPSNTNPNNNWGNNFTRSRSLSCDNTIKPIEEQPLSNRRSLETFVNKYVGRRAFIIGNGPSLKLMDLTKLKNEHTFGVNSIFYNFDKMGFKPTFYVVEDTLVAEDRANEINNLTGMVKIFGSYLNHCLADKKDVIWANVIFDYSKYPGFPHFSHNAAECLWVGGTVTYLCMQLAYYMGFSEVYLVGFDHNYIIPADANVDGTIITSVSNDPNHFHPEYFGKGKRWHDPQLDRMEKAYIRAKEVFEAHGRKIFNATVGGTLEIFPRVNYDDLFAQEENASAVGSKSFSTAEKCSMSNIFKDDKVRISVVVCTHRNPLLLNKTLESLSIQTIRRGLYEVIVVDNNSGDSTRQVVDRYPEVRYIFEEKLGLSHARNTGVQDVRGDIIAFIDDDAEASEGWLEALLKIYEAVPDAWAVGGKVLPIWDAPKPDWITEDKFRQLSLVVWGDASRPLHWPERIIGTNCSFRRQVFSDIGFFDTGLGRIGTVLLGNEDTEIQQRIHALGRLVYYTPDAVVHHHVPAHRMTREYFKRRSEGTIFSQSILSLRSQGKDREVEKINSELRRKLELSDLAQKQQHVLNASNEILSRYKDKHRGQRCVIIGNGPSLNKMDLSFLKNEITFGMNRIYLLFDKWDFRPTYYVSVNPLVIEQSAEQICKIESPKFLGIKSLPYIRDHRDIIFLQSVRKQFFSKDPRNALCEGHTVTYVAMQLAYFMGFSEVILIGVDHHFKSQGPANQEVVSEGNDENHFHPHYFGKGVRWNLPDLEKSEVAYRLAKQAFEADGRRIMDATVNGRLNIFPKADYKQIFLPVSLEANNCRLILNTEPMDAEFEEYVRDDNENLKVTVQPKCDPLAFAEPNRECLVSAIVSTYNSEKFLRGCLDDLVHQTIADKLEIIVVNSGSEQNEEAIVKEFQQKYNNIVYIKTEQREGIYTAWNRAAKVARGTFLTNANTDDRHREDALEVMAKTLREDPDIALVYGDQIYTDTPNPTFANHHAIEMARRSDYSRERLLLGCCVGSQPMWRKSLHNELGYFDETLVCSGDWDFWLRVSSKYRFKRIPEFLGLYYYNKEGIEHGRRIHSWYERYMVGRRYGTEYLRIFPIYRHRDNPLVSIIMPVYNMEGHIAEAIESVLIQNYMNFELIVVDDGSTDRTKDVVLSFEDPRVKYFHKKNGGPYSARNLGMKKATGDFIVPLDADDMITPNFISMHLQEFERRPEADLIYCDDYLIDEDCKPIRVIERSEYADRKLLIRDLFRYGFPMVPFRTCIRKNVFDKIGLFDDEFQSGMDYDMIRRFIKHGLKAHHLKAPLYLRKMVPDSVSRRISNERVRAHFEVLRRFTESFSYDELFPDVAWDKIASERRQLYAKCLAAVTYLTIGQTFVKTDSPMYGKMAFERACSELRGFLEIEPNNHKVRELLKKCELGMHRYEEQMQQAAV